MGKNEKNSQGKAFLIFNKKSEEAFFIKELCDQIGSAYIAPNLEKAIPLISAINFNVAIVDTSMAKYSYLRGLFPRATSLILTGSSQAELKHIAKEWPPDRYIDLMVSSSFLWEDSEVFIRELETAAQHSQLIHERERLIEAKTQDQINLSEAFHQIKEIKSVIKKSVVKEMEKRLAVEAKYHWFKKEKQRIEQILKKLYMANDVTNLLDIVFDIKELIQARGITIYIIDKSESLGKYLKPLVWDDSILAHTDLTKYVVHFDTQDFASLAAMEGKEINASNLSPDNKYASRYPELLKSPLNSILCVPIISAKKVIGVMEVYNKTKKGISKKEGFTHEDQQIMRELSEHISIAITKLNLIQYDALTGLLRPDPFFEKIIQKLKSERKRHQEEATYTLVMGDVDWFKNFNDRNGHEAGNKLLRELASTLKTSVREGDLLCRYGGEEFLFFLTGIKTEEESMIFTDRIRKNVEEHYFERQEFQPRNNLTMSFGITYFTKDKFASPEDISRPELIKLVSEADMALAIAKGKKKLSYPQLESQDIIPEKNRIHCFHAKKQEPAEESDAKAPVPTPPIDEKRKYPRVYTSISLIYRNHTHHKVVKSINLSLGGTKISTDSVLSTPKTLDLTVILDKYAFVCKGDVIYAKKGNGNFPAYFAGLKFWDLSLHDRQRLEHYITSIVQSKPFFL